jgi:hypothetical protein
MFAIQSKLPASEASFAIEKEILLVELLFKLADNRYYSDL